MSKTCPKCKKGKLNFFDGSYEHEPRWYCNECNYETDNIDGDDEDE